MTNLTRDQVHALSTKELWAIVRSTNAMSTRFANELTWAKEALRARGKQVA